MKNELDKVRDRFGQFLVPLFWIHVPILALVASVLGQSPVGVVLAGIVLAGAYQLAWLRNGSAPSTRYLSAVALMGEPALLVYLFSGEPWQMDMHMYFFATLALTIAWCDRRAVLLAATAVALHHLLLDFLLPHAVFPGGADVARVMLHAGIVAFQTIVLVWLSDRLVESFGRIRVMSSEIIAKNAALEERTREAEDANRAKSMFLANMSHEIRTPMNAILGFCHLVLRTELSPRQNDYITKINGAGVALLRLINDILDFSKNEAGKLSLEHRPFNLHRSIDNQLTLAAVNAEAKGVVVRAVIDEDVPANLIGDELRFNQVVLNLVSNAIKFTEAGTVTVAIQATSLREGSVTLEVSVRDTGIGMTEQQQASLFDSFTQADNSTTRRFGGTGLGLAISKQIIELMGGSIKVESRPDEGSVFTFTVVMGVGDADVADLNGMLSPEIQNLRVLIADDNPASREILQGVVTSWSMAADLVASGAELLGALETASVEGVPYDLVIVDWKMPGLNGIETVKAMRANCKLVKLPVVLLVTAYGHDELRSEAKAAEIDAFLIKPIDPRLLLETINRLLAAEKLSDAPYASDQGGIPMVAPHLRGLRVLLAEDNEINREIAIELLTDAGLQVDTAENGRSACAKMQIFGSQYAAILMDLQMPEMDGIEATVRIRKDWPADRLPIIAMTAHAYEEERTRCLAAGMNDHIAKPADPEHLVRTLDRWLTPRDAALPVTPHLAEETGLSSIDLPETLHPFGLDAALKRVNGKRDLLRRLIVNFGNTYADVVPTLRGQLAEGTVDDARRLAHTLKGVAGSLEISLVAAIAARIETALASDDLATIDGQLTELERLIAPAIEAASSLSSPVACNALPTGAPLDTDAVSAKIDDLRESLIRRSLSARTKFEQLAQSMTIPADAARLHSIKVALDQLDYERALQSLEEMTTEQASAEPQGVDV